MTDELPTFGVPRPEVTPPTADEEDASARWLFGSLRPSWLFMWLWERERDRRDRAVHLEAADTALRRLYRGAEGPGAVERDQLAQQLIRVGYAHLDGRSAAGSTWHLTEEGRARAGELGCHPPLPRP